MQFKAIFKCHIGLKYFLLKDWILWIMSWLSNNWKIFLTSLILPNTKICDDPYAKD